MVRDDASDGGDGSSRHSGSASGANSETSSQRSDRKALDKAKRHGNEAEEGDLLEQKRSVQDGIFACMFTLVRQSALKTWQFTVLKVVLEGLMGFIVTFNPGLHAWLINTNNPVWIVVRWSLWRSPIMRLYGYDTYITVMYVMAGMVLVAVLGLVWLTLAMRKAEQSKWLKKAAIALHVLFDVMFMMCYVSFFDYFVFTANCNFGSKIKNHNYFPETMCLEMPHLLHMIVACVTALVFFCITALMVVASCDLNPISLGHLASPAAQTRIKILCAKAVYVIASDCLESIPKVQSVLVALCVAVIVWWNFRTLPFYRKAINCIWCGIWLGILYTAILLNVSTFEGDTVENRESHTLMVLYGIFPVVFGGILLNAAHIWWAMRPAKKFLGLEPGFKASKVHKFEEPHEVERLARVMRVFDIDGVVDQEAAEHGETIIKAGMQTFPNSPFLYILYANYLLEVKKDGPSSRTQLQLAAKHAPSLIERYQVFCTNEASKRLKDSQDGGMDLQAYIEFKRNYRAVIRVHKEVLGLQTEVWKLCLKSTLNAKEIDEAFNALDAATARAHQVYKRVLERYPNNGKLLRCYGKFLEDVKHDPAAATRAYVEANRNGGGDAILSLDLSGVQGAADKPDFLTSMSMEDAVIVINAEGTIMMVSQAVQGLFGFPKAELEGSNVSLLMPQPFSQRHPSYLQRYTSTGVPHILDTVREVVALHKERYVFPISLCVTRMSGMGTDSVFLGVVRPQVSNMMNKRAWISPNGVFLCGDQQFASMCGITEGELVGRVLSVMVANVEVVEPLLERCREASAAELESGAIKATLHIKHRYLDPVPVDVVIGMGGTDAQRILVLNCTRTDGQTGDILVVDTHMRIKFAAGGVAQMLGYPMRKLTAMRLDQLLPPPFNTMHAKWLKDPPTVIPSTSCRRGVVVHLLNDTGAGIPVHIKVTPVATGNDSAQTQYVVQIDKVPAEEEYEEKRIVLKADFTGHVIEVSRPGSELFDFTASSLVGASLCDFIDVFDEWRAKNGESQLQLLLLALLDKEQETPGSSWRVRVSPPPSANVPHLPAIAGARTAEQKTVVSKSACMQVEVEEEGAEAVSDDGKAVLRVKVVLWRRDLLTGVIELDDKLLIRKANIMSGLIAGVPSSSMNKQPVTRFLDMPPNKSWEQITAAYTKSKGKKSAMKGAANQPVISPPMPFIGPHPDTGTMRIIVQGVQLLGPGGKPKVVTMCHPDTTYTGARANIMRVLKLEASSPGTEAMAHRHEHSSAPAHAHHAAPAEEEQAATDDHKGPRQEAGMERTASTQPPAAAVDGADPAIEEPGMDVDLDRPDTPDEEHHSGSEGERENAAEEGAKMHRKAASKSEFVAQWVRTLTNQVSGPLSRQGTQDRPSGGLLAPPRGGDAPAMDTIGEEDEVSPKAKRPDIRAGGSQKRLMSLMSGGEAPSRKDSGSDDGGGKEGRKGTGAGPGEDEDKASESGSEAESQSEMSSFTAMSSGAGSAADLMVDARRGKLLKTLNRLLLGPFLMEPLERLRLHSYGVLAVMLIAHVICYVIINQMIKEQHTNVYMVYRQAMAMDRGQLIIVRAMMGAYCERPGIAPVSVCENSMNYTLGKLAQNIRLQEEYHQGVYLGFSVNSVARPKDQVYDIWTQPERDYEVYLDTQPPQVLSEKTGVWNMGNRFIAAGREALYWLPALRENYTEHRSFMFLVTNGIGALYNGYAESLDYLVLNAWDSISTLRFALVALLVVEGLVIQVICTVYEWMLVQNVERARLVGLLAMLGLPGPVLRQLVTKELKVVDDSDDSDDDDESVQGDEGEKKEGKKDGEKDGEKAGGKAAASTALARVPDDDDEEEEAAQVAAKAKRLGLPPSNTKAAFAMGGVAEDEQQGETKAAEGGEEDKEQAPKQAGGKVLRKKRSGSGSLQITRKGMVTANGKTLLPTYTNIIKLMAPFFLWNAALITIYAISLVKLQGMQGPLSSLNMASRITYRYTRVRAIAFAFVSADSGEEKSYWRPVLQNELKLFESDYNALMYGGTSLSMEGSVFNHPVPASTFASADFATQFFRTKRCFRYEADECFDEDSQYYWVTHNGLDVMVRRMLSEMTLLTTDADEDAVYNSTRYIWMFKVGGRDLYEGLQQAAELFVEYSISQYNAVTDLHTILMVVTVLLVVFFAGFVLRPYLARLKSDATRTSALLSHVPPEMDVKTHVRSVFRKAGGKKSGAHHH